MKQYYFLCGLPRCGNTLFASILNQNTNICVTANSIIPTVFNAIKPVYNEKEFLTFPNYSSLDNIVKNLFNNYYDNFEADVIVDRGPWGTPANLEFLKAQNLNTKFIVLKRPILEILASFIKIENSKNIEQRCEELMSDNGMIGKYYWSYKNLIKTESTLVIEYIDLCNNTKNVINDVYDFLNLPRYNHFFNELDQLKINNIKYNDSVWQGEYHSIRTKISRNQYNIKDYLPQSVINKYKQV
jgi:hypothetical protein